MKRRILAVMLAGVVFASCDLAPKYVRPAGAVPGSFPQGGIYPPAASDAPDVTRIGYQDFFTDERLRQVIAQGLANNRDLRVAAANVLAARAQYRVQRADQLPTIAATGTATYTNNAIGGGSTTDVHTYGVDAGFSAFEIDLFSRLKNLSRAALEQYFATEEAQRSTRVTLVAEIANAWLTLAADQEQLTISRANLKSLEESRSLTQARFRIGTASELESRQADTDYQASRNDVAVLETQIARDKNALDLLVGAPVPASLVPSNLPATGATIADLPAGISSDVLLRRPDVLEAEHRLIAEHANIGAARAAMFPRISLTAMVGTISTALSGLFSAGSFTYNVSPSISQTIFDSGRNRANVRLAEANRLAAIGNYEKAIQTAFREVADALAERGTIGEQMAAQTQRVDSAEVAARLSEARFRVGVASFLDALISRRTAYAARQQLVTTRLNRDLNLVELYRSLGGGIDAPPN
jgi:multidrug efflux system outer membrane protein